MDRHHNLASCHPQSSAPSRPVVIEEFRELPEDIPSQGPGEASVSTHQTLCMRAFLFTLTNCGLGVFIRQLLVNLHT
jgi:hypothetical protein